MQTQQEIARLLLEKKAVIVRPEDPFTYSSGIKGPIYCDNRMLLSFPDARDKVIEAFLDIMKDMEYDAICGVATAGIAWAAILAEKLKKPLLYARAKAKEHGKENKIEGVLMPGQKVVVIEDLISTGGSSINVIYALREAGGVVKDCIAIFTYEMETAKKAFLEAECTLHCATTFTALLIETGHVKKIMKENKVVLEHKNKELEAWSKRH